MLTAVLMPPSNQLPLLCVLSLRVGFATFFTPTG